jgi:hypothetical protein
VDITDLYAFPSPERAGHLVLIMDVFPMATPDALFSDVVTHRFRIRPLARTGKSVTAGTAEYAIDVTFSDAATPAAQQGRLATTDGRELRFAVGTPLAQDGLRVFAGLASDPFFMDVEAAIRTDLAGQLAYGTAVNTAEYRDALAIVAEVPIGPLVRRFGDAALVGVVAETLVTRRGHPIRLERVGRPEMKNVILANPMRDPRAKGVELRDLYNREDAFALSPVYRMLYESRIDANLPFFDGLDGETAWPPEQDGRHPLRDLLINDYLIVDLSRPFAPGGFLEIERALMDGRPHATAGGRWLDDDILDDLLTWLVNGARGTRFGDGVDAPTKPASLTFPYVREPNRRTDLPLPAFLRS